MRKTFLLVVAVALLCGCREKTAQRDTAPARNEPTVEDLERSLGDAASPTEKAETFRHIIWLLLKSDEMSAAQERFMAMLKDDRTVALQAAGMIENRLLAKGMNAELIEWCEAFLAQDVPAGTAQGLYSCLITAHRNEGEFSAVLDLLPACVDRLPPASSQKLLARLLRSLARQGQDEQFEQLIAFVQQKFPDVKDFEALCLVVRVESLVLKSLLDQAQDMLASNVDRFSDSDLAHLVRFLTGAAVKQEKAGVAEDVCAFVMSKTPDKPSVVTAMAKPWVRLAQTRDNPKLMAARLDALLRANARPQLLASVLREAVYYALSKDDKDALKSMARTGMGLSERLPSNANISVVYPTLLDLSFYVDDFDLAHRIAKLSAESRSEGEQEFLVNKILAHKALKEGRKKEAVKRFRAFTKAVKEDWEDKVDPVTDTAVSLDSVLALNARRIGEILASMGDEEGSRRAFVEAAEHYRASLPNLEPGSDAHKEAQRGLDIVSQQK